MYVIHLWQCCAHACCAYVFSFRKKNRDMPSIETRQLTVERSEEKKTRTHNTYTTTESITLRRYMKFT